MVSILIVDDDIDKVAKIISAIRDKFDDFNIEAVIDSFSAQRKLVEKKFDILILDLNLPYRKGDNPSPDGGKILLGEMNRNPKIKSPNYIVGLTQFIEFSNNFSLIWNVIEYNPTKVDWHDPLIDIMNHILKAKKNDSLPTTTTETIFVEGDTDRRIIVDALKFYYPHLLDKVVVRSCAGAVFVARNIIIWGKSLSRNLQGNYIKAVGLLDGDEAGIESKKEIERVIVINSAEFSTFKIVQLSTKFAKHLIPIYSKGLKIPITLEELFSPTYWAFAESSGWLEKRQNIDDLLEDPKAWDKFNISLKDYIAGLSLSQDEIRYFSKFKKEHKDNFCKYLISLGNAEKALAYENLKTVLDHALVVLFTTIPVAD